MRQTPRFTRLYWSQCRTAKVLVVDDEEYIRDLVSSALRIAGFESLVAHRRAAGPWPSVAANDPDLVILDVGLPGGIDGFEVCRRLRADGDDTPVIFLTARDTNEDKVSGLHQGRRRLPDQAVLSLEELVARVRAVLRRSQGEPRRRQPPPLRRPRARRGHHAGQPGRPARSSSRPPSSSCCASCSSTGSGCCPRARSSTTCGSTTSAAAAAWWRTTSPTCARRSTTSSPPLIHTVRGFGYVLAPGGVGRR